MKTNLEPEPLIVDQRIVTEREQIEVIEKELTKKFKAPYRFNQYDQDILANVFELDIKKWIKELIKDYPIVEAVQAASKMATDDFIKKVLTECQEKIDTE